MKPIRIVAALAVAFALVASAGAGDANKADKKAQKRGTQGVVEKVDAGGKTLTVKTGKKKDPNAATLTLAFNDATKVTIRNQDGEKDGKLTDVAAGKRVMVFKETKEGKEVVSRVTIVEARKKNK